MKNILILWLALGWASSLSAQLFDDPAFRPQVLQGMDQTYNLSFEAAAATFDNLQRQHPEHPAPYFLQAFNRWWQAYLSVTTSPRFDYIEDRLELAIDKIEDLKDQELPAAYDAEIAFFGFMAHALEARSYAYRNEWWSTMGAARRTISPLEDCIDLVGQAPELDMVAGVYHYYVATYHQTHPIIRPVLSFFPPGDEVQGLKELQQAARTPNHLAQVEAMYFLGTIYNDEINRPQSGVEITRELTRRYPRNTWFQNDYAHALIAAGQWDEAQRQLNLLITAYQAQEGAESRNLSSETTRYTTYLMVRVYHNRALAEMGKQEYASALRYFNQSNSLATLAKVEEDAYLPANQLYQGMCHDYLGQRKSAIDAYELVLGLAENEEYKDRAKAYLRTPASP
jgi:tetratricopeptide (TPR) repeat protein